MSTIMKHHETLLGWLKFGEPDRVTGRCRNVDKVDVIYIYIIIHLHIFNTYTVSYTYIYIHIHIYLYTTVVCTRQV